MPRDSSGNYTLPAGNPVVTGTTISSSWGNSTLTDIATVLTASLDRNGQGSMLASLKILDGVVTAPGLAFGSEPTTGLYRIGANSVGFSIGGTLRLTMGLTQELHTLSVVGEQDFVTNSLASFSAFAATIPMYDWQVTGNAANAKRWRAYAEGLEWILDSSNDAQTSVSYALRAFRSAGTYTVEQMLYGNPTDSPGHVFYGAAQFENGVSIVNPGSTPLSITSGNGIVAQQINGGTNVSWQMNDGTDTAVIEVLTGNSVRMGSSSSIPVDIVVGTNASIAISTARNVVVQPPASGVGLYVNGVAGTHSTQIEDTAGNGFNAGYLAVPVATHNANYTAVLSDNGKAFLHNDGSAYTHTIPSNASVPYEVGATLTFENIGAGVTTIAITTDTMYWLGTGATGSRTLSQYGKATAHKVGNTTWVISGVNLT